MPLVVDQLPRETLLTSVPFEGGLPHSPPSVPKRFMRLENTSRKLRLPTTIICSSPPSSLSSRTAARDSSSCISCIPSSPPRPFSNQTYRPHLFPGWPQATIRDLPVLLLFLLTAPLSCSPNAAFRRFPKPLSLFVHLLLTPSLPLFFPWASPPPPPSLPAARTNVASPRATSIYPPSGMILYPGAHFGDSLPPPAPERQSRAPPGATPNREPAVGATAPAVSQSPSPLARADFASSPPLRRSVGTCTPRVFHGRGFSYPVAAAATSRITRGMGRKREERGGRKERG